MALRQYTPPHPGALIRRTYVEPFAEITGNKIYWGQIQIRSAGWRKKKEKLNEYLTPVM